MQKKLIAVAVGGALASISAAPVLAQNATVNVYGTLYGEYSWINNGNRTGGPNGFQPYQSYDHFQTPGSEIGFRGEEKLGGGVSVWFQCASTLDYRGPNNGPSDNSRTGGHWCTRNSALGLRGGFGNVFYGNWQTPWTRINSAANVGSNDTGVWGNAHIISGTSTTTHIQAPTGPGVGGSTGSNATVYRRRQNNLMTYETPNFAGFRAMGAFTSRNYASAATANVAKTRLYSVGAQYANGPIFVGAAYEKHANFYQHSVGVFGDDRGWTIGASYTLPNRLKLGGHFNDFKSKPTSTAETKIRTWHFGIDWMITGPHGVRAAYSRAGNVKGPLGEAMDRRPNAGPDTSADMWQIRYVHALSKRTEVTAGISWTNNRRNANYETGGTSTNQTGGSDSHAYGMALRHTF